MKLDKHIINLAANWQVFSELSSKGIFSVLWEDCYERDDLINLHSRFKDFSYSWYKDEKGTDISIFDGLSIGDSIAYKLYNDLETWIRIFYLFEYIVSVKKTSDFYVLNKDYFPKEVYEFIKKINGTYKSSFDIKSLQTKDKGLEFSVAYILGQNRNFAPLEKCRFSRLINLVENTKSIIHASPKAEVNCLLIGTRRVLDYLAALNRDAVLNGRIRVYLDNNYYGPKILIKALRYKNVFVADENIAEIKTGGDQNEDFVRRILKVAELNLERIDFLDNVGREFFAKIFRNYIEKTLLAQLHKYAYFERIIKKYNIDVTVCGGHDSPESYYFRHLMDKHRGRSFFLPHGLTGKDKHDFRNRELLAHYYFCYSEAERKTWLDTYSLFHDRMIAIRFFERSEAKRKIEKDISETKILILLDNFQVSLLSKINYFNSFSQMCNLLRRLGFSKITVRTHPVFFNFYPGKTLSQEVIKNDFYSFNIQLPRDIPLKSIISKYDIIIGPLTTCVYEAICNNVFFIPYIPDFFPAQGKEKIAYYQWLPGLFPHPCTNLEELKSVLLDYKNSARDLYNKFFSSLEKVNAYKEKEITLWENILKKKEQIKKDRIIFIGSSSSFISSIILAQLIEEAKQRKDIEVSLVIDLEPDPKRQHYRKKLAPLERGVKRFLNPQRQDMFYKFDNLLKIAKRNNICVLRNLDINAAECIDKLSREGNIVFSCANAKILSEKFIKSFEYCFNYHNSLLPQYRGIGATPISVYKQEKVTGFTFHILNSKIDQGNVLLKGEIPVDISKSGLEHEWDKTLKATLHVKELLALIKERAPGKPQSGNTSYYSKKEFEQFFTIDDPERFTFEQLQNIIFVFGGVIINGNFTTEIALQDNGLKIKDGYIGIRRIAHLPPKLYHLLKSGQRKFVC